MGFHVVDDGVPGMGDSVCRLLGIRPKKTPAILGTVAVLGMVGIWSEIYVLVVPSLSPRTIPLGWVEILVTAGFLGAFWLCSVSRLEIGVGGRDGADGRIALMKRRRSSTGLR